MRSKIFLTISLFWIVLVGYLVWVNGIVSKGDNLVLNETSVNGAILNYSASFFLMGDSDIVGSVVSNYSVDLQGELASITRGNIPEFSGLVIGLDPFVVPGSYLEY